MEKHENRAVISGIGQSDIGRPLDRDPLALTIDGCLAAIEDAGLRREDIDGIATYPGMMAGAGAGFSGAGVTEVHDMLRLELNWFSGGPESPGQLGSVIDACAAVATGLARHVLCFRSVWEATAQRGGRRAGIGTGGGGSFRAPGGMQWTLPFGAASAACWIAMFAQRHFHEFGTTREQLAQIALNARKNAALNPKAIYRDPLSLDPSACTTVMSRATARRRSSSRMSTLRRFCAGHRCASSRSALHCTVARPGISSTI